MSDLNNRQKRALTEQMKVKILNCAAEILEIHGSLAGDRVCQDWSGDRALNPRLIFNQQERADLAFNYELKNSNLRDYEEDVDFLGDEMIASWTMAYELRDLAKAHSNEYD